MADPSSGSSDNRPERPVEREAVRTTIVGGRPPGCGTSVGSIPRGIEVLVKKAAVDADFRRLLLERRAGAAEAIGLVLTPAEAMMLAAVEAGQLEGIIDQTVVPESSRRAFMGAAAAAMLAAVGVAVPGCVVVTGSRPNGPSKGVRPDNPAETAPATGPSQPAGPIHPAAGVRDDRRRPPQSRPAQPAADVAATPPEAREMAGARADVPPQPERPPVVVLGIQPTTGPASRPVTEPASQPASQPVKPPPPQRFQRSAGVRADIPPEPNRP